MAAPKRKRPWYLVVALLGAVMLGSTGACNGWTVVMLYREPIDPTIVGQGIADEGDRSAVISRFQALLQALDVAKARGWPLAVADLVLGGAILATAMRSLGRGGTARRVLIQALVAQAVVTGLSYVLLRDVFEALLRLSVAKKSAELHETINDRPRADEMLRTFSHVARVATPIEFAIRTLGGALIIVALTRRRSRDFLDSSGKAVGEP
jgi:hypothetical protein